MSQALLLQCPAITRRRAVDSALGSLRIEGMELKPEPRGGLERFSRGDIDLAEMHAELNYLANTIV